MFEKLKNLFKKNNEEEEEETTTEDKQNDTKKEVAKILLEIKAITLNLEKPYRYVSGILSPIYCDNRILMSFPEAREKIRDFYIKVIEENKLDFEIIGGIATSGIPPAAWIADKLKKPMIYIRKAAKDYGKENLVEGKVEKDQTVLVIEDLCSTGGSSIAGVEGARSAGAVVDHCIAIFSYKLDKCEKGFKDANCTLHTLSDFPTLIQVASETGYITEEEKTKALEWFKNPDGWGKKMGYE